MLDLDALHRRCDDGDFAGVHDVLRDHGELDSASPDVAWVVGRARHHLGAPRSAVRGELVAYRRAPRAPAARYLRAYLGLGRRGVLETLRLLSAPMTDAPARTIARWCALRASVLGELRDFDAAEAALARAESHLPGDANNLATRIGLAFAADRHDDAAALAESASLQHPANPYVATEHAAILVSLDRRSEAIDVLVAASGRTRAPMVAWQLAELCHEAGRHDDAERALARYEAATPLREPAVDSALACLGSTVAYARGDLGRAAQLAERAGTPGMTTIAARLRDPSRSRARVSIAVPLVRQHHDTCFPASLTMVARHFGREADHLAVAEAICFDGTPTHSARAWAESNGYRVFELTLTWETIVALADRGLPFVVTTLGATAGHAMVVTGYDALRGTVHLRDPSAPTLVELFADELLARFASTGPTAMVLLPPGREDALEGLVLVDAALHDRLHRVHASLTAHDRATAATEVAALEHQAPGHRLTLRASFSLARYDGNDEGALAAARGLAALFPGDPFAESLVLEATRGRTSIDDCVAAASALAAPKDAHPVFTERLAEALSFDARNEDRASRLARRAHRMVPSRAMPIELLARVSWRAGRFEEALGLHRLAACAAGAREDHAASYVAVLRASGRDREACEFLAARHERWLGRAAGPSMSYAELLEESGRADEAESVLASARARRPDDGDLAVFTARLLTRAGRFDDADAMLVAADGTAHPSGWSLAAAELAAARGDRDAARELAERAVARDPLSEAAHAALAARLLATEGPAAVNAHFAAACARYPHARALLRLRVSALGDDLDAALAVLDEHLSVDPSDAWALRERALDLGLRGDEAGAERAMAAALAVDPCSPSALACRSALLERFGHRDDAHELRRSLVVRAPDAASAISAFVAGARGTERRRAALRVAFDALLAVGTNGDGPLEWLGAATGLLPRSRIRAALEVLCAARPGWPSAAIASARNLRLWGETGRALLAAEAAAARFPITVDAWVELAACARTAGDVSREVAALRRGHALAPTSVGCVIALASALARAGDDAQSAELLDRARAFSPRDGALHLAIAEGRARAGDEAGAVSLLDELFDRAPEAHAALVASIHRAKTEPRRDALYSRLRGLVSTSPGDVGLLHAATELASALDRHDDVLSLAAAGLAVVPRSAELHDERIMALALLGRLDEAKAAVPRWSGDVPFTLRGRAAWLRARSGDLPGAIQDMRAVVAADPGYTWGHLQIGLWCRETGRHAAALAAMLRAFRSSPESPTIAGEVVDSCFAAGRMRGAASALRAAGRLDPTHLPWRARELQLRLDFGHVARARELAELDSSPLAPEVLARWRVRLAVASDDAELARSELRAHVAASGSPAAFYAAWRAMMLGGLVGVATEVVEEALARGDASEAAAELGLRARLRRGKPVEEMLLALPPTSPAARGGARVLGEMLESRSRNAVLWYLLRRRRFLREDAIVWARAGAVLVARWPVMAWAWLAAWQSRVHALDAEGLLAVVRAREAMGLFAAPSLSRRALSLPDGPATAAHRARLAFTASLRGDDEDVDRLGDGLDPDALDPLERYFLLLARGLSAVRKGRGPDRAAARIEVLGLLRGLVGERIFELPLAPHVKMHDGASFRLARDASEPFDLLRASVDPLSFGVAVVLFGEFATSISIMSVCTALVVALTLRALLWKVVR
jgi:tetratricopeptide (TPR) repeat protein